MDKKINIRHLSKDELKDVLIAEGQPSFRANQVWQWIWQKGAKSFEDMSNLPKPLREELSQKFNLYKMQVKTTQKSEDGTIKIAFNLYDNEIVEGVLIPQEKRMTACISSQVGCSLTCKFCATATLDRKRNLYFDEIYDQVEYINRTAQQNYGLNLSNIVFMGMGEPLLNYNQVIQAIKRITAEDGLGMSPKRITVSTAGVAKMIHKLADEQLGVHLALSLHAANEEKRSKIMPINETNNLSVLKEALKYYYDKTNERITLEYILLKDFNDSLQDAEELVQFAKTFPTKVNIIEYNPIENGIFEKASGNATHRFKDYLESRYIITNIRRSRGKDIDAACGQLANKHQ